MTCVVQPCPTLSNLLPRLDSKNIIYFNQLQHPSNLVQPFRARAYARNLSGYGVLQKAPLIFS